MTNIAQLEERRVTVGVDTHLDIHVASAIDSIGLHLGDFSLPTNPSGYQDVVSWAKDFGEIESFGLEGTGCYGAGLAQYLWAEGIKVVEIPARSFHPTPKRQVRSNRRTERCSRGFGADSDKHSENR